MLTTRETLDQVQVHLEESMGVRDRVTQSSHLSPMPRAKDVGRRPHASFGTVAIDRVIPDPSQPRTVLPDEALDRLARSIRKKGQLSPIRVRWSEEQEKWTIIAGERRWQATKRTGLLRRRRFLCLLLGNVISDRALRFLRASRTAHRSLDRRSKCRRNPHWASERGLCVPKPVACIGYQPRFFLLAFL